MFLQPEAKGGTGGAGPPEGREEGGAVDPWVGEAQVATPPKPRGGGRQEGEGQKTGAPRPQGPKEMALALGATPPPEDVDLGGAVRPAQVEEGRAIVASDTAPEAPMVGGEGGTRWGKSPVCWPNLDDAEGGARFVLDDPSEAYL